MQELFKEMGLLSFLGSKVRSQPIDLWNLGLTNFPKTYALDLTVKFRANGTGTVVVPVVELLIPPKLPYKGIMFPVTGIKTTLWLFLDW